MSVSVDVGLFLSLSFLLCLLSPSFLCLSFFGEQLSRWSLPVLSLSSLSSRSYLSYLSSLSLSIEEKELQQCPSKMVLNLMKEKIDLLGQVNHAMELKVCSDDGVLRGVFCNVFCLTTKERAITSRKIRNVSNFTRRII